jgi:DNA-3-methyladenine glycosylase I
VGGDDVKVERASTGVAKKVPRCDWTGSPEDLIAYHDVEWGRPLSNERDLFERLCLEGFQSGLSWLTVLRKREAFRKAFAQFDPAKVAKYSERHVGQLMSNAAIIRSRPKIEAAIANARAVIALHKSGESLAQLIWSHAPRKVRVPRSMRDVPAITAESTALAKALKKRGFRFVGPTTVYAMMQAVGIVNDHVAKCFVRAEVAREREQVLRQRSDQRSGEYSPQRS